MTTYAEALAAAKRAPHLTRDGAQIGRGLQVCTPAGCVGRVVEVAHCMDEVSPGVFEPWHLLKMSSGLVTTYPSDLLWIRNPLLHIPA